MASSPVMEPAEKGATPAVDLATKPTTDEAPEETPSAQAQDSGSATSLSNTSSSTRNLDTISETATTSPGEVADDAEGAEAANKTADEANDTADESKEAKEAKEVEAPASPPPLPDEPLPEEDDDGWDPVWSDEHQAWYFYNRITQQTQWDNPRVPTDGAAGPSAGLAVAGGYNPAIHGDYDPTAWYATGGVDPAQEDDTGLDEAAIAAAAAAAAAAIQSTDPSKFRNSQPDVEFGGGHRYTHEAKSGRQLNAYFDVQASLNEHDGRSLKAERSGIKPTKAELKAFKEKRRAKKEEKRRAWLRD